MVSHAGTLFLNLVLAILVGFVPMQVCQPTCGRGGGIVVAGAHAHERHEAGECGHDHGDEPRPADHDGPCCEHVPSTSVAPGARPTLPTPAPAVVALVEAAAPPAHRAFALAEVAPRGSGSAHGPPAGVESVVLLR